MDLVMLTLINAQERSKEEFQTIFHAASPNFRFVGVTRPAGCRMSIVEAVWEGEDYGAPVDAATIVSEVETKAAPNGDNAEPKASQGDVENATDISDTKATNDDQAVIAN
jgi:hypothetical protein